MMYLSDNEAKNLICEIGRKMFAKQFVAANDGNITIRTGENTVIATPTGVNKGDLTPDKLLKVDFDGNILEGTWKPTCELYMHLGIYKENNAVQSTCHAHPIFLSAYAIAGLSIDLAISPETSLITGTIPIAPYAGPGTPDLAASVKPFVNDYNMVLLANHGPIAWGTDPMQAWFRLEAAEAYAKECTLIKYILGEARMLSGEQLDELGVQQNTDMMRTPRRTKGAQSITNLAPGRSLAEAPVHRLCDADIDKIADKVAEKLRA